MLKIALATYLFKTIEASVGIEAFVQAADYHHTRKTLATFVVAGRDFYIELVTQDGAYLYDMVTFGSERFESRRLAQIDFGGIDETSGPPDVMAVLDRLGLAFEQPSPDIVLVGIRRIVFEEGRIAAIDALAPARSE